MKTQELIAYKGEVELEEARWDNAWGMTVKLKLEQRPHEMTQANPFKRFTKMRKDKVGTRFQSVFVDAETNETVYSDETMLKGWSDGTSGWKLTLWIQENEHGLHPFMDHEKGRKYALVMVELDDDNEAVNQAKRDRVERANEGRKGGYRLSTYAAMLCQNPDFWEWIGVASGDEIDSEDLAAEWMRETLGIESRRQLDLDEEVAERFHTDIRRPYHDWFNAREALPF